MYLSLQPARPAPGRVTTRSWPSRPGSRRCWQRALCHTRAS